MPLSDHEQRLLEQMERALYEDDPKFAVVASQRQRREPEPHADRRRILRGRLAGLVVVVVGVAISIPIIGVVGFAAMVAGAFWAWTGTQARDVPTLAARPAAPSGGRAGRAAASPPSWVAWRSAGASVAKAAAPSRAPLQPSPWRPPTPAQCSRTRHYRY